MYERFPNMDLVEDELEEARSIDYALTFLDELWPDYFKELPGRGADELDRRRPTSGSSAWSSKTWHNAIGKRPPGEFGVGQRS
jgi:hypothetical protein